MQTLNKRSGQCRRVRNISNAIGENPNPIGLRTEKAAAGAKGAKEAARVEIVGAVVGGMVVVDGTEVMLILVVIGEIILVHRVVQEMQSPLHQ